jgi:hypothetical protein
VAWDTVPEPMVEYIDPENKFAVNVKSNAANILQNDGAWQY